jgi:hypothetical protein
MRILAITVLLLALPGCAAVAGLIPTLQHCHEVNYHRQGNQITLDAKCSAPIGSIGGV